MVKRQLRQRYSPRARVQPFVSSASSLVQAASEVLQLNSSHESNCRLSLAEPIVDRISRRAPLPKTLYKALFLTGLPARHAQGASLVRYLADGSRSRLSLILDRQGPARRNVCIVVRHPFHQPPFTHLEVRPA